MGNRWTSQQSPYIVHTGIKPVTWATFSDEKFQQAGPTSQSSSEGKDDKPRWITEEKPIQEMSTSVHLPL